MLSTSPFVHEPPAPYAPPPLRNVVYEIGLWTSDASPLRELPEVHRIIMALLQGRVLGLADFLDFVVWPGGLFTRVRLKEPSSLSGFLKFLKEKTLPPDAAPLPFWNDELQWIKLVPEGQLEGSTRSFLERAASLRGALERSGGDSPHLFFYYRDPRFVK